ncbi:hypothetical protein EXIGLDRAFT_767095 [Exidia glandulosa HHB12029]|uniref:Uncharacterized protein n=1 Tax=Exidia glandulosa HHB12029 TaxID=1314781 RepID=A0A166ARE4_EXIGL|nr:hypothetical protein EXIGLDRAFT_767095 [Exidia glandulosa HHB12029]
MECGRSAPKLLDFPPSPTAQFRRWSAANEARLPPFRSMKEIFQRLGLTMASTALTPAPSDPPKGVTIAPGVVIFPSWNAVKAKYAFTCDLCGLVVDAGVRGHSTRFFGHRGLVPCQERQAEQALAVVAVQRLRPDELPLHTTRQCPGAAVYWSSGSVWSTYPFQYHARDEAKWSPVGFDSASNAIFIRSPSCFRFLSATEDSCAACRAVVGSAPFLDFLARASNALPNTPYVYLSHTQVAEVARQHATDKIVLRSKLDAAIQSQRRWKNRTTEHQRILVYIAANDIAKLRWIVSATLNRGSNPTRLMSQLIRGAHDAYQPHGFSKKQLVASYLGHAIGKPKLMHSLGRAYGLVSKRTVDRNLPIPRLLASITCPTAADIEINIEVFLDPEVFLLPVSLNLQDPQDLPGHVLMFDGIALEQRARYCTLRDQVLGLSRETASNAGTSASTIGDIDSIRTALQEGRVRFGSEATVVAAATYTDTVNYSPVPLVVSPSDKTEKGPELQAWISLVLDCWKQHRYTKIRGPVWSLASDGDAAFRYAKHRLCTVRALTSRDATWTALSPLRGFNRYTSADGLTTATCDPKHIIKRFATLLRNPHGIMIGDVLIQPRDILFHLTTLKDLDRDAAVRLLDPADKQNVPKAVALMQRLFELQTAPLRPGTHLSPVDLRTRSSIVCFGQVLEFFVRAFITPALSLSEQLVSLSAFAHAITIFQLRHGSACFTGALYADM